MKGLLSSCLNPRRDPQFNPKIGVMCEAASQLKGRGQRQQSVVTPRRVDYGTLLRPKREQADYFGAWEGKM